MKEHPTDKKNTPPIAMPEFARRRKEAAQNALKSGKPLDPFQSDLTPTNPPDRAMMRWHDGEWVEIDVRDDGGATT